MCCAEIFLLFLNNGLVFFVRVFACEKRSFSHFANPFALNRVNALSVTELILAGDQNPK